MESIKTQHLVLTVGLPRSGKSTWSKRQGVPMVNPDAIRLALHGQTYLASAEPMVWAMARYMVMSLFRAGHPVVILDATNVSEGRRAQWLSSEWNTYLKVFRTTANECKRRALLNHQGYLLPVIDRMSKEFETPARSWKRLKGECHGLR